MDMEKYHQANIILSGIVSGITNDNQYIKKALDDGLQYKSRNSIPLKRLMRKVGKKGDAMPVSREIDKKIADLIKKLLEVEDLAVLSNEFIKQLRTAEYLFVIDMGCGSTSAACLMLEDYRRDVNQTYLQNNISIQIEDYIHPVLWKYPDPLDFTIKDGLAHTHIPTLIGYNDIADTTPVLGPKALDTGYLCENFKEIPTDQNLNKPILWIKDLMDLDMDPEEGKKTRADVWQDYFYALLTKVLQQWGKHRLGLKNLTELSRTSLVMVAHPAGKYWSKPDILRSYKALIRAKTGLAEESVLTVSEAKAAMQYVRRHPNYKITLDFAKGVLIIDIGASTIDVEYLSQNDPDPLEFSLTMAGRNADRLLAHYVLEQFFPEEMRNYPEPDQIPEEDPKKPIEEDFFFQKGLIRAHFLYQIRVIKEQISTCKEPMNISY